MKQNLYVFCYPVVTAAVVVAVFGVVVVAVFGVVVVVVLEQNRKDVTFLICRKLYNPQFKHNN